MKAPVTYEADLVKAGKWLFNLLWDIMPWEQRDGAPRREAWFNPYGEPYTYGSGEHARTYEAHDLHAEQGPGWFIHQVMNALNEQGTSYDCCFVNGYKHGRDHLGWHSDDSPEMDMDHPIATVSLGAEREIWFRRKDDASGQNVEKLMLGDGSVAIMGAGMQRDWQHRIPKSSDVNCGPRISLTYRRLVR